MRQTHDLGEKMEPREHGIDDFGTRNGKEGKEKRSSCDSVVNSPSSSMH